MELLIALGSIAVGIVALLTIFRKFLIPSLKKLWSKYGYKSSTYRELECIKNLLETELPGLKKTTENIERNVILSLEKQRAIIDESNIPTFETNEAGLCIYANKSFLLLVSRPYSEIKDSGWVNIIKQSEKDSVLYEWNKALKTKRNFEKNFTICTPEGREIPVFCKAYKLGRNTTVGYLGVIREE